ncbi:hypothetical protein PoB_006385500 [Plakobranchus ocellatus]|uniref:Uncharacterized protein n=1 Tax=Plakobranchus ocellatus TaxID=259542 RepID=A0AAV4CZY4_9GAST|nr:hypothetical protein PoB_006385500 [Plakobranchus ocellatus]
MSPMYCREAVHGRQPTVAHVLQRQYVGDNPMSPTYCREAVHGRQPTVAHVLQRGSTWATMCHHPCNGESSTWAAAYCHP